MNLGSIIDGHPAEATALISRGRVTTYGTLRDQVAALRGGLIGLGLTPGERVAIVCANNWYFVVTYLAVIGAGMVAVPLNPQSPTRELEDRLAAVGARAVMAGPSARAAARELDRGHLGDLRWLITAGSTGPGRPDGADGGRPVPEGSVALDDLLAADPAPVVERSDDDLAVLIFTSGVAGSPKAAKLTHAGLAANLNQITSDASRAHVPDDVIFGVLPLHHIYGLNVVLGLALFSGASVLLIERFDPVSAIDAIVRHSVTSIAGPPTMWSAWAALPDAGASVFSTVRIATSGAAHLPPEVAERVRSRYGVELHEGYGLTEASPVVTSATGLEYSPGSIGRPLAGVEVRLVDADGSDVLVGDAGEIWVRGPNVFAGYWDEPEATAATITAEGWLRTGDLAVLGDDDHQLYLVDRAKDLIIVSGFNVYPAEVEEVLVDHPAIELAAVVGVSHPHTGEAIKAYVVVAGGASIEEDEIIEFCAERIARYKCPSKVNFVDDLPMGMTGKVLRRALR